MNELIPLHQMELAGEAIETVNARELHAFLEVKTQFKDWIKRRIDEYGFVENVDFVIFPQMGGNRPENEGKGISLKNEQKSGRGRPSKEYFITLDMAKELAMVERNERGRQARKYFIECERRLKRMREQPPALDDPAALRGLLLNYTERVLKLEQKIEEDKPKVTFFDKFVNADGLYGLQNAARAIGAKPNKFVQWLKRKYLFYQGNALVARARYIQMGIFEVKTTIVDDKARPRTYITPKGLKYLAERVPDEVFVTVPPPQGLFKGQEQAQAHN